MAPAIDALETGVIERTVVHPGNPVLTWNFANAISVTDPAGNRKIDKSEARCRIDGAVATAMALGLKARDAAKLADVRGRARVDRVVIDDGTKFRTFWVIWKRCDWC